MRIAIPRTLHLRLSVCVLLLAIAAAAFNSNDKAAQAQENKGQITDATFKTLQFRSIGPAIMGGRIDDFAVVEASPSTIYAATASGGLWKTINNGTTWDPLFDNQEVSSIGDVTLAPSNPDIVWVGTGEANNRQSSSWGNGVYKSTDGGKTWANMGLKDSHHIGRIVIHPTNPDIVYVAAGGHLWGPNKERGLFKTSDGGKTWVNTKFIDENTGFTDVAMDPSDPNILYAAAYQRRRTAFGFLGGGPGSALYKTSDGGSTWTKLTNGLPSGDVGRIGMDIYRKNPNVVYALFEHATEVGTYRSDDKGETWKKMSPTNPRPMYYSQIRIDPTNDQRLYVLGASWYTSDNGGRMYQASPFSRIHGDYHALWIDPQNPNHMITGSDGGIHSSYDKGRTWDYINTIPLGQFYEVGFDFRKPYWVYGGLQDNGSWGAPVATLNNTGVSNDEWIRTGGGDGFYAQVDPKDWNIVYSESQNGAVQRLNLATTESKSIRPQPPEGSTDRYRFDWNSPIMISPHNNRTIYMGGNRLFKSLDRGDNWTASPDLTKNIDRNKLEIMGVVPKPNVLSGHDGQDNFSQIVTVAESPVKEGVLWVGTDDGNVQVSRDGSKTWKNVIDRIKGVPANTYVTRVIGSYASAGRAYVTFDGHRSDDFKPYVYVTEDFGENWTSITNNLPSPANVIREHPKNQNLLLAGTEFGLFVSFNRGASWMRFKSNLPTVPVDDIQIHPRENDLILATHGRSIWVLDDMTPLQQMSDSIAASDAQLFDLRTATMWRSYNHKGSTGHKTFIAPNPPSGALISYYLREKLKDRPKITILDKKGAVIRELLGPNEAGVQRTTWDMRYQSATQPPQGPGGPGGPGAPGMDPAMAAAMGGGGGGGFGGFGGGRGPRVLPGEYIVKLTVNGKEMTKPLVVEEDPRIKILPTDAEARLKTLLSINKIQKSGSDAQARLTNLRNQLTQLQESMKKQPNASAALGKEIDAVLKDVTDTQQKLGAQGGRGGGGGGGFGGGGGGAAGAGGGQRGGGQGRGQGGQPGQQAQPAQAGEQEGPPNFTQMMMQNESAGPGDPNRMNALMPRIGQLYSGLDSYTEPVTAQHREKLDRYTSQLNEVIGQINKMITERIPALNKQISESGLTPIKAPETVAPAVK